MHAVRPSSLIGGDGGVYACVIVHVCAGAHGVHVCEGQRTTSDIASTIYLAFGGRVPL